MTAASAGHGRFLTCLGRLITEEFSKHTRKAKISDCERRPPYSNAKSSKMGWQREKSDQAEQSCHERIRCSVSKAADEVGVHVRKTIRTALLLVMVQESALIFNS